MSVTVLNTTASLSGKTLLKVEDSQTITGLKTFDLGASAPLAVSAGSAKVTYLDADKLDGLEASAFYLASKYASIGLFNVKDYGALGDGLTNDTVALEAAKSAVSAAGGGIMFFPAGTYLIDYTSSAPTFGLYFNFGVQVCGVGPGKSVIKNSSATAAAVRCAGDDVYVRDLTIDNNSSSGNAFQQGGQYTATENLEILNQGGAGYAFVFSGCTLSLVKDVHIKTSTNGFRSDTTASQYCTFLHCSVETSTGTALSITSGVSHDFVKFYIEDTAAAGNMTRLIDLDACHAINFYDFSTEQATRTLTDDDYVRINNCKTVNFYGGRFSHAGTASKSLFRVTGTTTKGVQFDGLYIVSTKASMVLFEVDGSATLYGVVARNITTDLTSAATGVLCTSTVIGTTLEDWVDNNTVATHTLSGPSQFVKNVGGDIASTYSSPGDILFVNCTGTLSGTGVARSVRINCGTSAKLRLPSNTSDIQVFADNAAAKAGSLGDGDIYRTATGVVMVVYT